MSNELIPTPDQYNALACMAKSANASKFYQKVGGEEGLLSIMLLARELDVSPMMALAGGIWNIQGKVEMSARMMNMKIRQSGHKMKIDQDTNRCIITGTRKDTGEELTVTFSMEDAKRAELAGGNVWKKYPREMLFNRCLSIIARMLFPDVIGNCYVEGEISDEFSKHEKSKPAVEFDIDLQEKVTPVKRHQENAVAVEYAPVTTVSLEIEPLPMITPDEAETIKQLLGDDLDRLKGFCEYYKIEGVNLLPRSKLKEAISLAGRKK